MSSQLRYVVESRILCWLAPFAEKDDILVSARVWHRPGKRDQEALDRERARLPRADPRRIAVPCCTRDAGQTATALMTSDILAAMSGVPVAALDLNPGATSLATRASALSIRGLLAWSYRWM